MESKSTKNQKERNYKKVRAGSALGGDEILKQRAQSQACLSYAELRQNPTK